jgi:transcriptional regulator with XRE-family HTH domain
LKNEHFYQKWEVVFMSFATNFKRICDERGTSPTRVCLDLGLSSSKVNLWNNGAMPKADVVVKLAKKLECSVMDFFEEESDITNRVEYALDEDEKDIIRAFRMLSRQQKHETMARVYSFEKSLTFGNGDNNV